MVTAGTVDREFAGIVALGDGTTVIGESRFLVNPILKDTPIIFLGSCSDITILLQNRHKIVVCGAQDSLRRSLISAVRAEVAAGLFLSNDSFRFRYE